MPTPTDAFLGLSLSAAQNLNIVNGVPTLQQESLLATNRQDVYRWNLSSRSSLNLALSSLSGNANVGVGIDVNQNGLIDSADQFWQSSRDGVGNETIQLELLEAGTYYVVVNSVDSVATGYDLRIVAQTRQQTDILWRNLTNSTLGYWQFEGLQYIGSKQIPTPVGGEWTIEGIGDFNGDINDDILWRERSTGKMAVWLMANGTYTATPILNNVMVTADWQVKGVADIDLDGKADVVWHNPTSGDVYLWKMDGANRVSDKLLAQGLVGNAWALEKVADFNGDRTGDLLWRHQQTGELHLWGMTGFAIDGNKTHVVGQVNGQGQFTALQIPASTGWKIEGAGDFTGDGKADLLWRNSQGQIAVWAMDGWKVQSSPIWQGVVVDSGWQLVGIDDFSGDGKTDALWQHQSTGDLVIWQMNGTQTPMGSAMVNPSQNGQIKAIGTAVRPVVWDEAGDTWALATGLGTVTGSGRQVGTLSGWDRDDFYRFSLSAASPIGLWLHDLTGNGELQLLDS
ncbi:FG-GAP repeat domain-containing protein, partial [Alkalinema pantanalense CENA528]|uniref:FG-GAP repeat domain-containing protein n=1 Tax=Alkalinema pantanalense TaxID=1620705 RepID=UPI003D6DCE6A